jgi:FkbM family methyltransferase
MLTLKIILRSILRGLGINKVLVRYFYPGGYERRFDDAMFGAIKSGDVIWDVGANVGYYTVKFAEAAGEEGFVQAFEPMPETFKILKKATSGYVNISLNCCALGRSDSNLSMSNDSEVGSPTNKILTNDSQSAGHDTVMIKVRSGDSLIASEELKVPNFIKIDVEGHESEAIKGIAELLTEPELRTLAIEIHFAILEERGLRNAPGDIVAELKKNNFTICWTDPSHIVATRT